MTKSTEPICPVDGCARPVARHRKGFCFAHYYQQYHGRAFTEPMQRRADHSAPCKFDGCDKGGKRTKGYCIGHYNQLRLGRPLTPLLYQVLPEHRRGMPCSIEGCDRGIVAKAMCAGHYYQVKRGRKPGPIMKMGPKGEGTVSSGGYRKLFRPEHPNASRTGSIAEHRLVMSDLLGRPLLPTENVHHINGDRLDNRPENLELWSTSQPKGQRVPDKVAWAREILDLYGDDF